GPYNRNPTCPPPRKGPAPAGPPGARPPLPGKRMLPPSGDPAPAPPPKPAPRPPNFIEQARQQQKRPPLPAAPARPAPPQPSTRPSAAPPTRRTSQPQQPADKPSQPAVRAGRSNSTSPQPVAGATVDAPPPAKKQPTTIEELIPHIIRFALKRDDGLNIAEFDEKLMPRVRALVPESLQRMEKEVTQEYMVDIAHALYVAIVVGQFTSRPVLCGVRAAELAADLVERVLQQVHGNAEKRMTAIRCGNLLVGLTLNAVRMLESTSLASQALAGFTDNYERAVITTYGLKTQAESTGSAPWLGQKNNPLDKRIGAAINTMSNVFGDYIGEKGETLDEAHYDEIMREFDGFMDRFAPYIEGGRSKAEERRKKVARSAGTSIKEEPKVEPLEIKQVRTRPAGVEVVLADGRILFCSRDDARRIGEAADAEVEDTGKRERAALEARMRGESELEL
ncbi:MAG: hypothetical protein KJ044_13130, partial [Planctomycetes bacterium]|nr:hypothetical protein [Planctomycetota bacterium]